MPHSSRRGFLRGSLLGGAAAAAATHAPPAMAKDAAPTSAPVLDHFPAEAGEVEVSFKVNGEAHKLRLDADEVALDTIRERLDLTGCKRACGHGACGACAVLVDGVPQAACLLPSTALEGSEVSTVEALGAAALHPVQRAFMANDALQCGFCTPGFVVEAAAFHDQWRQTRGTTTPSREEIADALSGHLCRCGAYQGIYAAVAQACSGAFDHEDPTPPRHEARAKVTGEARYTVDVKLPGMLHAAVLRSPFPHAKLTALGFDEALAAPGVRAAVSVIEPGRVLRYVGQPVAVIAAVDRHSAEQALAFVDAQYEVMPAVIGAEQALAEGAPVVYPDKKAVKDEAPNAAEGAALGAPTVGNLRGPAGFPLGKPKKVDGRMAEASHTVSESYTLQTQVHTTLEPHACVAWWKPDGSLEVHASTQSVYWLAEELAELYALPFSKVQVLAPYIGGGFGAKAGMQPEIRMAVDIAREAGAPVKLVYTREAEASVAGLRPGCRVDIELGATADGQLAGLKAKGYSDGGCSLGSTVASMMHFIYASDFKELEDYDVLNHGPPGKPFRGPGGPASTFALEGALEALAAKMGEDSLSLRQAWDVNVGRLRLYEVAKELPMWRDRRVGADTGRYRRGTGLATGAWLPFVQPKVEVRMTASKEGFELAAACQDMGNGSRTVVANAAAGVLGVAPQDIRVVFGDSKLPPACLSGGSRTTPSMGPAAERAAAELREALLEAAEDRLGLAGAALAEGGVSHSTSQGVGFVPWSEVLEAGGPVSVTTRRGRDPGGYVLPFAIAGIKIYKLPPGALQVTEVEVDTRLGTVRALKSWSGVSVGRIYSKPLASSQVFGGVIQGVSYALYEDRRLCPKSGVTLTSNLEDYRIMGIGDAPEMEVYFDETPVEGVLGGGIGLSEAITIPVAASVANAVGHATGWRPTVGPIRPERVLAALSFQALAMETPS